MKYLNIKKALTAWQNLQPLSEKDRERLSRRFTVDFNYNSNHIEGNTLTYGQTEILLLFGKVIGEADVRDVQEMTASNVGLRMMTEEATVQGVPLTQNFIRTLHKTILREDYTVYRDLPGGMQTSYVIHAGQYKTRPNSVITRYGDRFEYASPEETPGLMGDLVDWYNTAEQERKLSPVELAALFHYRYIRIHPFEDGNGRIARLLVNYILTRHDYPMIVVRSRKKSEYLEALHQTDLEVGPVPSDGAHFPASPAPSITSLPAFPAPSMISLPAFPASSAAEPPLCVFSTIEVSATLLLFPQAAKALAAASIRQSANKYFIFFIVSVSFSFWR